MLRLGVHSGCLWPPPKPPVRWGPLRGWVVERLEGSRRVAIATRRSCVRGCFVAYFLIVVALTLACALTIGTTDTGGLTTTATLATVWLALEVLPPPALTLLPDFPFAVTLAPGLACSLPPWPAPLFPVLVVLGVLPASAVLDVLALLGGFVGVVFSPLASLEVFVACTAGSMLAVRAVVGTVRNCDVSRAASSGVMMVGRDSGEAPVTVSD